MRLALYISVLFLFTACSVFKPPVVRRPAAKPEQVSGSAHVKRLGLSDRLRFQELYNAGVVSCVGQNFDVAFELFSEASRINPRSASTAYELARLYQDVAGQDSARLFPIADSLLQASVRLDPENKYFKIALIENYQSQGRFEESIKLARDVADANPNLENYLRLEKLCEMYDDYEGTIYALEHLERLEGMSLENSLYRFWAYQKLGREDEGYRVMEDLCKAYPTELRYRVKMGDLYLFGGHEEIALATYNDVLTEDPNNDAAQYSMLDHLLQKGDSVAFAKLLPRFLSNPRASLVEREILMDGYLLDKGLESPDAIALYDSLLMAKTPTEDVVTLCSEFLGESDVTPVLKPYYHRVLHFNPTLNRVRIRALQLAYAEDENDSILSLCRAGRNYEPTNPRYYFLEGNTLARMERYDEALEILDDGTQYSAQGKDSVEIARLFAVRGEILSMLGDVYEAFAAYDSALVYNPDNPLTMANYATELSQNGEQFEKALDLSQRALQYDPEDPFLLGTYAYALSCLDRYDEARDAVDQALSKADSGVGVLDGAEYARLLDTAGDIYFHLGHTGEAVKLWQRALPYVDDDEVRGFIQQKVHRRRI